ncbi:MFS transporter [Nocardioides sp. L-11A]|uniref:MFS transporter n=1 Tax=Nocardioides sp. L-11A TaxID=3043848 RepID=UPI00249C4261|nr:MFS transporter [Nocardioides sp. L-11A]
MLVAASNAVNPLLPTYREALGLTPLVISMTFTLYVAALVVTLFAMARPQAVRRAGAVLLTSLFLIVGSDLLLADAQEWSILVGRVIGGAAGGLGTGAASALMVAAVGAKGRAITATGNTAGAIAGAAGSQLLVSLLSVGAAPRAVFFGHSGVAVLLIVGLTVVLGLRREDNRSALAATPASAPSARAGCATLRLFVPGIIVWTCVSLAGVFSATLFDELDMQVARAIGPVVLPCATAAVQLGAPAVLRLAPRSSGMLATAGGIVVILVGAWFRSDVLSIIGFVALGAGVGTGYRTALVVLTKGSRAARQGALASLYAAACYSIAAAVVTAVGVVGNQTGLVAAVCGTLALFGALALSVSAWVPRVSDAQDALTVYPRGVHAHNEDMSNWGHRQ